MKYALKAIYLAIQNWDFVSAWKLTKDVYKNADMSDRVFKWLKNKE